MGSFFSSHHHLPSYDSPVSDGQLNAVSTPRVRRRYVRLTDKLHLTEAERRQILSELSQKKEHLSRITDEFQVSSLASCHKKTLLEKRKKQKNSKRLHRLRRDIGKLDARMEAIRAEIPLLQEELSVLEDELRRVTELIGCLEGIRTLVKENLMAREKEGSSCLPQERESPATPLIPPKSTFDGDQPKEYQNEALIRNLRVLYVSGGRKKNAYNVLRELERITKKVTHKPPESDYQSECYDLIVVHRGTISHSFFYGQRQSKEKIIWIPQNLRSEKTIEYILTSLSTRADLQYLRKITS